ncbi:MAG TPA: DUF4832 domain-containing protein [Kofleriaceae bacterium]|nr:DUF4832 domain-containing protein [Kofleriaceae bacterium]
MRTKRSIVLLLLASLALAFVGCADSEDALWDDRDDGIGEVDAEVTVPGGMVGIAPTESLADFPNPERGFYKGYNLVAAGDATSLRNAGYTMAIALVELGAYRNAPLPASLLTSLNTGFAKARAAGIKLIVRFRYDNSGGADAPLSRILSHITQLTPVLRDNYDVIAVVQAGFIGAWGEWHGSTNGNDTASAHNQVLTALLTALPSSRSVDVRRPDFKNAFRAGALTSAEAFNGSSKSRIGHHNDCFLASDTDMGTYVSPAATWESYTATDSAFAPDGGETCAVYTARTSCSAAMAEMARMHFAYLNREYQGAVINGWVDQGCDSTIHRLLGYRFVMTRVAYTPKVAPGGVLGLEVDIKNRGYSIPMNQRPIDVVLTSGSTRLTARLALDARRLPAGATTTVKASLRLPANLAAGTYTVSLRLPDAASRIAADNRYAIQFANTGVWNASTGDNVLTKTLTVSSSASPTMGLAIDHAATTFVQL